MKDILRLCRCHCTRPDNYTRCFMLALFLNILFHTSFAQSSSRLFASTEPIIIESSTSMKASKKAAHDSLYAAKSVRFSEDGTTWHTLDIARKARGNFRLEHCYFPPLKVKLKSKNVKGTVFEGNKNLKLVTPCLRTPDMNELILKEYLIYKMYQEISSIYLNVRLVNIKLMDTTRRKPKQYDLLGFLVEDNDLVALRAGGTIRKGLKLHPRVLEDYATVRHDFFQYMIGNSDWSTVNDHNENTILVAPARYYPLPYDFDMAGLVNASYANENAPVLGTGDIRERVYRGFCRPADLMDSIRREYLDKEKAVYSIVDQYRSQLGAYNTGDMKAYLKQFFDILRDDQAFQRKIIGSCRTNK